MGAPSSLLLAGATGLIGREVLQQAAGAGREVLAWVRRAPDAAAWPHGGAVRFEVVDFAALPPLKDLPAPTSAVCALGTTLAVAGSQAAFRAVDFSAVLAFAQAAKAAGVKRLAVVSALGADPSSSNFYSRVKGEAEEALKGLGFAQLVLARPSLLMGNRDTLGQPARRLEALALRLSGPLSALVPRSVRPIHAADVARALLRSLDQGPQGVVVLSSGQMQP
jgi:uncharacterized protein YbjT (DUF2867 family)